MRERVRRRGRVLAFGIALGLLALPACGAGSADESLLGDGSTPKQTTSPVATKPAATPRQLLRQRAAAVLAGDEKAFLAPVMRGRPAFLASQRRLYANLRLLPVAALSFRRPAPHRVERSLTLRGFDTGPLVGAAGFDIRRQGGRLVVAPPSTLDEQGADPWDLVPVKVLSTPSVLLVTGEDISASELDRVVGAVTEGVRSVPALPGAWDGKAVVYLFRDPAVLASYSRVPGGNLEHLGALSFPVRRGDDLVGSRIALLPAALDADPTALGRLMRHELTHVALGTADDEAPTWLVEGIAEYVAAKPMPPSQLRIATAAVERAKTGFDRMPAAATFNDSEQELHYAVAWMASDYLATTRGESVLLDLLTAMDHANVGRAGTGQDAVLRRVVGLSSQQLARKAAQRTLRLFGPGPAG